MSSTEPNFEEGTVQSRRNVLRAVGVMAGALLAGTGVASASRGRTVDAASAGGLDIGRWVAQVSQEGVQTGDPVQNVVAVLTQGQGLWYQEDYLEPVQYISWIPGSRTHAFYKFALEPRVSPWLGIGHRQTILRQPNGFTFSPSGGLVTNHTWHLGIYPDDQGVDRWVLTMNLDPSGVGVQAQPEFVELLSYDDVNNAFGVYNWTVQREGVWQWSA